VKTSRIDFVGSPAASRRCSHLMAVTLGVSASVGCTDTSTVVKVSDPTKVSLAAKRWDGSAKPLLPPASEPREIEALNEGGIQATAVRRSDGGLELRCAMCADGTVVLLGGDGESAPVDRPAREVAGSRTGDLAIEHSYLVGTGVIETSLTPVTSTPWSNVAEVRERSTPVREMAIPWLTLGGLGTLLGVLFTAADVGAGVPLLVGGLGLGGVGVYQLAVPTSETVVYDGRAAGNGGSHE